MQCSISVRTVDYLNPTDRADLLTILDMYARDPMGGGDELSPEVKARLCDDLAKFPGAKSWSDCSTRCRVIPPSRRVH
jgi:hypothetical protein